MRPLVPLVLVLVAVALPGRAVFAQPQIPSTFYGTVTVDGAPPPDGTDIRAFIAGLDCTQLGPGPRYAIDEGLGTYVVNVMHESQKEGCGREGRTVTFSIDGRPAKQTATWHIGPQELNLSAGSGTPVPLPTRTPTPTAPPSRTGSSDPGAGGAATSSTPAGPQTRPGTPPTDDITLTPVGRTPGTPLPSASRSATAVPPATASGDGGGSAWPWLAAAAGFVALAGGGAGLLLSRRLHKRPTP